MKRLRTIVLILVAILLVLAGISALRVRAYPVAVLATKAPRRTALMQQREREARKHGVTLNIDQRWVGYSGISPELRRAILIAEDDKFYSHDGLDWDEIKSSARTNLEQGHIVRGGSTITQQLAKNLFLGDARTITRKLEEAFLAVRIERALSKRRIFELYLNLIEWGDGIFGAEAAARHYFGVPASQLSERQAVLLAAVIINPRRFSVLHPARRIERRVRLIAGRMRRRGYLDDAQYAAAIGRAPPPPRSFVDWFFGSHDAAPAPVPDEAPGNADSVAKPSSEPPVPPAGDSAASDTLSSRGQ